MNKQYFLLSFILSINYFCYKSLIAMQENQINPSNEAIELITSSWMDFLSQNEFEFRGLYFNNHPLVYKLQLTTEQTKWLTALNVVNNFINVFNSKNDEVFNRQIELFKMINPGKSVDNILSYYNITCKDEPDGRIHLYRYIKMCTELAQINPNFTPITEQINNERDKLIKSIENLDSKTIGEPEKIDLIKKEIEILWPRIIDKNKAENILKKLSIKIAEQSKQQENKTLNKAKEPYSTKISRPQNKFTPETLRRFANLRMPILLKIDPLALIQKLPNDQKIKHIIHNNKTTAAKTINTDESGNTKQKKTILTNQSYKNKKSSIISEQIDIKEIKILWPRIIDKNKAKNILKKLSIKIIKPLKQLTNRIFHQKNFNHTKMNEIFTSEMLNFIKKLPNNKKSKSAIYNMDKPNNLKQTMTINQSYEQNYDSNQKTHTIPKSTKTDPINTSLNTRTPINYNTDQNLKIIESGNNNALNTYTQKANSSQQTTNNQEIPSNIYWSYLKPHVWLKEIINFVNWIIKLLALAQEKFKNY